MATFSNMNDNFYDDAISRSPRSYRSQQPQLNRANSRPMDSGYGSMQGAMFSNNNTFSSNHIQQLRYGGAGPFAPQMPNGMQSNAGGNIHFPYDSTAAQTWNAGTSGLPSLGMGLGGHDPSRSVRPSRGRGPVSNVRTTRNVCQHRVLTRNSFGMTSLTRNSKLKLNLAVNRR